MTDPVRRQHPLATRSRGGMSVKDYLDRFVEWRDVSNPAVTTAAVAVRTETLRRGLTVRCVGSKRWRQEHPGEQA